jgi:homoserine O-succinyltransferase
MPESAVDTTERQFLKLMTAKAGAPKIRLHRFMLPEPMLAASLRPAVAARYASTDRLDEFSLDALIVTGNEPRTPTLPEEPYWNSLTKLIDWAQDNTISALWSCLAAHAAVLHLNGVERRPLDEKRSGVFEFEMTSKDPIIGGATSPILVPHSRLNELHERELVAHGYDVLTHSAEAGVDAFIRRDKSLFLFFQGHPEYEAHTLLHEYRRDLGRFLRRENDSPPAVPRDYFDAPTQARLEALTAQAQAERRPDLLQGLLRAPLDCAPQKWGTWSTTIIGNWLAYITQEKAQRDGLGLERVRARR